MFDLEENSFPLHRAKTNSFRLKVERRDVKLGSLLLALGFRVGEVFPNFEQFWRLSSWTLNRLHSVEETFLPISFEACPSLHENTALLQVTVFLFPYPAF